MLRALLRSNSFRDNIVFVAVAFFAFTAEPMIVNAQQSPYNPVNFTQALNLSRGNLSPNSPASRYLSHDDSCKIVQIEFGWEKESCAGIENIVFSHSPGVDTVIIEKPNSDGFVKFDDWDGESANEAIKQIWDELVIGSKEQSKKLGIDIIPKKWSVYPKLDRSNTYMYYAILLKWGEEGDVINIKASLFDRRGYVAFRIVPDNTNYSENELSQIVESVLNSYTPTPTQSYVEFTSGDKVAAGGAIGVLATLVGVKYGKAIATGAVAIALAFAKKLWFLIFIPIIAVWKMLFRKNKSD